MITAKTLENPFEGWTTIEDAAEMLGRSKHTLYGWARTGKITCFPVGRKMRVVNIEEVREFSEKHSPPRSQLVDKNRNIE